MNNPRISTSFKMKGERTWKSIFTIPVITQAGDSALLKAAAEGKTEVVSLLVNAGAALDLQNEVWYSE